MNQRRNETLARISTDGTALELDAFGRTLRVPVSEVARRFIDRIGDGWGDEWDMDLATRAAFRAQTIEDGIGTLRYHDWMFPDERRKRDGYPRAAAQDRWGKWDSRLARHQPAARQAVAQWLKAQSHENLGIRLTGESSYLYESAES